MKLGVRLVYEIECHRSCIIVSTDSKICWVVYGQHKVRSMISHNDRVRTLKTNQMLKSDNFPWHWALRKMAPINLHERHIM